MLDERKDKLAEKATSFSNIAYIEMPLVVGLSVHIFWTCLMFTETVEHFLGSSVDLRIAYGAFGIVFLLSFFVGGFLAGFDREHITKFIRRKWAHFLVSACGVIGCLLFVLTPSAIPPLSVVYAVVGALLAGVSCAFATVLWGEAARRRPFDKLAIITVLAFILAFFAALLAEYGMSPTALDTVLCLSPFASLVLVYKAQHDNVSYFKPQEFLILPDGTKQVKEGALWIETFHDLHISKGRFALTLGKSALPFGMVFGSLAFENYRYLTSAGALAGPFWTVLFPLGAVFLFIVLFFRTFQSAAHPSTSRKLFLFFFVFLLFTCADSFLGGESFANPSCVALLAVLGTMLWFYPAELTHRYRISALLTFGYFAGFLALGVLVSTVGSVILPFQLSDGLAPTLARMAIFLLGFSFLVGDEKMRSIASASTPQQTNSSNMPDDRPRGTFTQRCQAVADTFLLSRRELELLIALAKGRNASYIQRELTISEGTVRTHMRNIYRKLDVHNQQELIDLVDEMPIHEER